MKRLSDHLACAVWVELSLTSAAEQLAIVLARYGPVEHLTLAGWTEVKAYLLPLRSFATRYALLDQGGWTIVINDRYGEMGLVDGLAISRATGCRSLAAYFSDDSRQWHVIADGRVARSVVCYLDGGKWFFHQTGTPDPIEDVSNYLKRRTRDRLPVDLVRRYVNQSTRLMCPPYWSNTQNAIGLRRSIKDLVAPITTWDTIDDA